MHVVRGRYLHRLDAKLVGIVEHPAIVRVERNLRDVKVKAVFPELRLGDGQHVAVAVAERRDFDLAVRKEPLPVFVALAPYSNDSEPDLAVAPRREASACAKRGKPCKTPQKVSS